MKIFNKRVVISSLIGLIFMAGGFGLLALSVRSSQTNIVSAPAAAASASVPDSAKGAHYIEGKPTRLQIPSLHMDLQVIPGYYDATNKEWTLTTDKAQYATVTVPANNSEGNTFIYGHYRKEVFASLHTIQPGAEAIVTTDTGHTFTYRLTSERVTKPNDASLFAYKGKPILTIQTCSGVFFQNRQLFTFDLEKAQ